MLDCRAVPLGDHAPLQPFIEAEADVMRVTRSIFSALCAALITLALIPTIASAIPRDVVLSRGMVWVRANTPYSQARYAFENGTLVPLPTADPRSVGYRTDCSGFVSMCWNLRNSAGNPINLDTAGLDSPTYAVAVTKEQLEPGDMMLRAKDKVTGGGHAVIFMEWADTAHATYWSLEEQGDDHGTIKNLRNYDKDYTKSYFRPYRYRYISPEYDDVQVRVQGLDRYETAAAAVEQSFPASTTVSVSTVVLASGETWPDALGGSALAGVNEGPLLLTARAYLPPSTRATLARLKPQKVILLGGTATVSEAVESQIASMGIPVTRIGGADRYAVSRSVAASAVVQARARGRVVNTAYLATGLDFPDALAVSPISARFRRPILLTRTSTVPAETLATIKALRLTDVVILGGTGSVSENVASELTSAGITVTRIGGVDRYAAAIGIAHHGAGLGMTWKSLGLASGNAFADALCGGVAQGQSGTGSMILLTRGDRLSDGVAIELRDHRSAIGLLRVFGGSATVQPQTRAAAAAVLRAK